MCVCCWVFDVVIVMVYSEDNGKHVPKRIYTTKNGKVTCYECNVNNDDINAVIAMDNIVKNLRIKCQYNTRNNNDNNSNNDSKEGIEFTNQNINDNNEIKCCNWVGFIRDYEEHLSGCEYKHIVCQYCKLFKGIKVDLIKHYDICGEYIIDCPLECDTKVKRKDIDNHKNNDCNNFLLDCKNDGCNATSKRIEYDNHISVGCEYLTVVCPFKKYGCDVEGLVNKNLDKHLQSNKIMHYLYRINFDNDQIKQDLKKSDE